MVYDRLREWQAPAKYRRQRQPRRVARAVKTPPGDVQIHAALSSIGIFLDDCFEKASWPLPAFELDSAFQRLMAEALMAISSTDYDTAAIWRELRGMEQPVADIVKDWSSGMHPRVLSVLLRVLVQNQETSPTQRGLIRAFRRMVWKTAVEALQASHPVALLCGVELAPERTEDFLEKFSAQMGSRLHDRVSGSAPDFVAREKIYTARAFASFGFSETADGVLDSVASLTIQETFTSRVPPHDRVLTVAEVQSGVVGSIGRESWARAA